MSSGSGSKKRGGTRNFPLARPTGLGLRAAWGIARSSATGTLWLQITTVSPPAAEARYADSLALACATLTFNMTIIVTRNVLVCKHAAIEQHQGMAPHGVAVVLGSAIRSLTAERGAVEAGRKGSGSGSGRFLPIRLCDPCALCGESGASWRRLKCAMAPHLGVSCGRLALI